MYSYLERMKAVELLIQYNKSHSKVRRELGYPSSRETLRKWYKEYINNKTLHQNYVRKSIYTDDEKLEAVIYYLEHGMSITNTIKKFGYPCRQVLSRWISELAPEQKKYCHTGGVRIKYSHEKKQL